MEYNMPVTMNGDILGTNIDHEEIIVSRDELEYIVSIGYNKTEDENANEFGNIDGIEKKIGCLFAIHKIDAAWNEIEKNIDKINFIEVTQTPFFQMDRTATSVYGYLYSHGLIDDASYAYFNVASGRFFDTNFMYKYLGDCNTAEEVLAKIHSAYNGVEPSAIGMLEYTDELRAVLESVITPEENLSSYILGIGASIDFPSEDLIRFLENGNIDRSLASIVALCVSTKNDANPDENAMNRLWEYVIDSGYEGDIEFITLPMLSSFISHIKADTSECMLSIENLFGILVNAPAYIKYPRVARSMLSDEVRTKLDMLDPKTITECIDYGSLVYAYGLEVSGLHNIRDYFIKSPECLTACRMVYNRVSKNLYIGAFDGKGNHLAKVYQIANECDQFMSDNAWIFSDNNAEKNQDIFDRCDSAEEYEETKLALQDTWKAIKAEL